jgi:hypothetical protein
MTNTELNYTYKTAHYPNTVSWYRELVYLGDELVGEICEPIESTPRNKIYDVRKYELLQAADVTVELSKVVKSYNTVCDCKEYINSGGIQ